jgi:PAS domain S-box-containing protein
MIDDGGAHVTTLAPERHAAVLNDVLRIVLRNPNLLQRQVFEDLARVVSEATPIASFALALLDGPGYQRIYGVSPGPAEVVLPFGERLEIENKELYEHVYVRGEPYFQDDASHGTSRERMASAEGYSSYLSVPVRSSGDVRAQIILGFGPVAGARQAPLALLQDIAGIVGDSLERVVRLARERRLAMILETSGDAMLAWDRSGVITDANAAASSFTGRNRAELLGTPITKILGPAMDQGAGTPPPSQGVRMDLARRSKNGGEQRVAVAATITAVEDDPLVAAHVLLRDLSHVVAAERAATERLARIRELEEQHRTLLDNAPLIIFRLDPTTTELVYLNRHAERLLGVPTGEALRTRGFLRGEHADPEGVLAFDNAVAGAKGGAESLPYEARLKRRHGEEILARGTVYPLLSERGEVVAIEGVLADVSAERAARTRLVQTDRLSTLGTLAAGVAHEINNPAAFLLLGLDMLDRNLAGPGVLLEPGVRTNISSLVTELRESIRRIVDIARDLRLFASPPSTDAGRMAIVDVNRTVESALTLTRGQIIERAAIVQDLREVPPVLMRDGRLGQVIVNLLVNAAQAIPQTYPSDNTVSVITKSDGHTVEIEVSDTGVGINPENMGRIWAPFFTTKTSDVGTGLGLPISREIVEGAGGTIAVESPAPGTDPPRGSRFVISLPAAGRVERAHPSTMPPARAPAPKARVLLVEDEVALARALADEIRAAHDVTVAESGPRALQELRNHFFDVVLCDIRMPGMSGDALYGKIAVADPVQAERFIFMTGVGFGAGIERFLSDAGRPVLEKPFSSEAVLNAIAKVVLKARRRALGSR